MFAVILLLVVALLSLLITRIATIALAVTGMSHEAARFQARSALTGVGFTTGESESIVDHAVRRRIVMTLMLVGNAGLVTAIAALLGSFVGTAGREALTRGGLISGGLLGVYLLARSEAVDRLLTRAIAALLDRLTDLQVHDYARLLHLAGGYRIEEMTIGADNWLVDRTLAEAELRSEGMAVLGITREDGTYIGAPNGDTCIRKGDTLALYGYGEDFVELSDRPGGDEGRKAHEKAVEQHRARQDEERASDPGR